MPNSYLNKILLEESQKFIEANKSLSAERIILKYHGKTDLPIKEISEQIEAQKKAVKKLPELSAYNLVYKKIPLEQCSSEYSAQYKSRVISGKRIIDLTGGLGIDSIYFARNFKEVTYCEMNEELAEIAEHNFSRIGIKNIKVLKGDSIELLKNYEDNYFDWVFADPARRNNEKRSVDIKYYSPNIPENLDLIFSKAENILLKLAPAFDINEALKLFKNMYEFSVLSYQNECKEVLVFLSKKNNEKVKSAVILDEEKYISGNINSDYKCEESEIKINEYLYEPNAAIRKAGLTDKIAFELNLKKLNRKSELLFSANLITDFIGRKFVVKHVELFNEKKIRKFLTSKKITKANISRSNFPMKPEEIKERLKLKDGGDIYLFFTKDINEKSIFILTEKIP